MEEFIDIEFLFLIHVIVLEQRSQQSPFFSQPHAFPSSPKGSLNIPVDQFNFTPNFVGCFHRSQQLSSRLLTFIDAQLALFSRKHGLHQHHGCFSFLDDLEQTLFVEPSIADQGIVPALAQLNRYNIRLVFSNLLSHRLNRSGGDVGGSKQTKVAVNINRGCLGHQATSTIGRTCACG